MTRMIVPAWPKSGLGKAEFHSYWRKAHGELTARRQSVMGFLEYEQNHRVASAAVDRLSLERGWGPAPEGVTAMQYGTHDTLLSAIRRQVDTGVAAEIQEDLLKFTDTEKLSPLVARQENVLALPSGFLEENPSPVKLIVQFVRKQDVSLETFSDIWAGQYADLVLEHATALDIVGYSQNLKDSSFPLDLAAARGRPPAADGIAELWWRSRRAAEAALSGRHAGFANAKLQEAERAFTDESRMYVFLAEPEIVPSLLKSNGI